MQSLISLATADIKINDSREFLDKTLIFFSQKFFCDILLGFELEFSLWKSSSEASAIEVLRESILSISSNNAIKVLHFGSEAGEDQYEIALIHGGDILEYCDQYYQLKEIIKESANFHGYNLSFSSNGHKEISNGLHLNISLIRDGVNLMQKTHSGNESLHMSYSVAGILDNAKALSFLCVSDESDFKRFNEKFSIDKERVRYEVNTTNSPTHISWGSNNRTCLIRIPDSHQDPASRHIEFRMPVPNADVYLVSAITILTIYLGLKNKLEPIAKTYGNAFDKQYNLEEIPRNIEAAKEAMENNVQLCGLIKKIRNS